MELIESKKPSKFEIEMKKALGFNPTDDDEKENFNIIINVLTKIYMVFGKQPFIDRSLHDPLFLYVNQIGFNNLIMINIDMIFHFYLNGWTSIITQWLKLDYTDRREYSQTNKGRAFR